MKTTTNKALIERVVQLKFQADDLPVLPPNEEAKLEHDISIDHLYYSSALEGSRLNKEQIRLATHEGISTP